MTDLPTSATVPATGKPDATAVLTGFGILVAVWLGCVLVLRDPQYPTAATTTPVAGLTIFAVFFVAAQAIERLLEPFAIWLDPKAGESLDAAAGTAKETAAKTMAAHLAGDAALTAALKAQTQQALDLAAEWKARAATSKANRRIVFWSIASAVGVLASASMKLYLLRTVGIATPSRPLELLATGLIIGGGTQPLHDLVGFISAKADTSKSAAGSKQG
jgi:hypothetical protein